MFPFEPFQETNMRMTRYQMNIGTEKKKNVEWAFCSGLGTTVANLFKANFLLLLFYFIYLFFFNF